MKDFRWVSWPDGPQNNKKKETAAMAIYGSLLKIFFFVYLFTAMQERRDQVEHVLGLGHPEWHA